MRILEIQGLRALAAILVLIYHAKFLPGGFIGVDLFYVISGFLITGIILKELEATRKLDLKNFYQRRIKRLLPTSVFVLIITAVASLILLPPIYRDNLGKDVIAVALYISNYTFAWWQNDYQNLEALPSPFLHYWSLAVEEQFYLIWPILIIFLAKRGVNWIRNGVIAIFISSLMLSIIQTQISPIWAFYSLSTRAWQLAAGALLLFISNKRFKHQIFTWLGVIAIGLATLIFNENTAYPGYLALLPVVGSVLLIASIGSWPKVLTKSSNNRIAQWLGEISYPLYLWHWPILVLPKVWLGQSLTVLQRILCLFITVIFAHLTSKYIEQPLRYKRFSTTFVYKALVGVTAFSVTFGVVINLNSSNIISPKMSQYSFDLNEVTKLPIIYDDGCHANYGETNTIKCLYGDRRSNREIVLFGDSHAAQWFPAVEKIASSQGYKLFTFTKASCSAIDIPRPNKGAFKVSECKKWQENQIAKIKKIKPDILILTNSEHYQLKAGDNQKNLYWQQAQRQLYEELKPVSKNVIFLVDTPKPRIDVPACLASGKEEECNQIDRPIKLGSPSYKKIDLTNWFCDSMCPAIKEDYIVYRDASHISLAAALAATEILRSELIKIGAITAN
jgi:peptidoglycan/LPS O-acetylase OafA/YrhL